MFGQFVATHRKAIVSATLGGLTGLLSAIAVGSTWQVCVVAAVGAALGVGVPTGAIPNRPAKKAA